MVLHVHRCCCCCNEPHSLDFTKMGSWLEGRQTPQDGERETKRWWLKSVERSRFAYSNLSPILYTNATSDGRVGLQASICITIARTRTPRAYVTLTPCNVTSTCGRKGTMLFTS